jgi:hypothetical protein
MKVGRGHPQPLRKSNPKPLNLSGFLFLPLLFATKDNKKTAHAERFWKGTMQTDEVSVPAESSASKALSLDLGQWLGRHQALACVSNFCSAADAHALLTIREQRLYRALDLTWDEFCPLHAGISRASANRIIENLKEFGDTYFNLTEILKIPVPEYRALQPAIQDNVLEFEGQRISINRENTVKLIEAVHTLRGRLNQVCGSPIRLLLLDLQKQFDRSLGQISGALRRSEEKDLKILIPMIEDHVNCILAVTKRVADVVDQHDAA